MMWWGHGAWGAGDWSYGDEQTRTSEPRTGTERADEVLAERFARGEIDEEEFIARRDMLHSTSGRS